MNLNNTKWYEWLLIILLAIIMLPVKGVTWLWNKVTRRKRDDDKKEQ